VGTFPAYLPGTSVTKKKKVFIDPAAQQPEGNDEEV